MNTPMLVGWVSSPPALSMLMPISFSCSEKALVRRIEFATEESRMKKEHDKWAKVIRDAKITPE